MAQQADYQLNKTYQQAIQQLKPGAREQLRNSQRAWLAFVEQNAIAFRSAAAKLGWTQDDCNAAMLREVQTRDGELSAFVYPEDRTTSSNAKIEELLPRLDAELNVVYQRCLHAVPGEQAAQLRQAQRAWITFRDASRALGTDFVYSILLHRIDRLNDFYSGPTKEVQPDWREKADASVPDPFERVRR
jgi:uncharacterized protein YecT (DUF1311 family)